MPKYRSSAGGFARKAPARTVSPARLQQRSGQANAFGGYTKVNRGGEFRMRPTAK